MSKEILFYTKNGRVDISVTKDFVSFDYSTHSGRRHKHSFRNHPKTAPADRNYSENGILSLAGKFAARKDREETEGVNLGSITIIAL